MFRLSYEFYFVWCFFAKKGHFQPVAWAFLMHMFAKIFILFKSYFCLFFQNIGISHNRYFVSSNG